MTVTEFLKDSVPFLKGITEDQARRRLVEIEIDAARFAQGAQASNPSPDQGPTPQPQANREPEED